MKNLIVFTLIFTLSTCTSKRVLSPIDKDIELENLVNIIISDYFDENETICLADKSISFDFKFPADFYKDEEDLTTEEMKFIEKNMLNVPIKWSETITTKFKSNCKNKLVLSKPIIFRDSTLAFVYESTDILYINLYEKVNDKWKLKRNLIRAFYGN